MLIQQSLHYRLKEKNLICYSFSHCNIVGILVECGQSFYIQVFRTAKLLLWLKVNTQTAAWEVFHASVAEAALKESCEPWRCHAGAGWSCVLLRACFPSGPVNLWGAQTEAVCS